MRWGKIVLVFQAVMVLIIGIIFFSQFTIIENSEILDLRAEFKSESHSENDPPPTIQELKDRFKLSAYILIVVSLTELAIISRLIN